MKILLQRVWERKIEWDDPVPQDIQETLKQWKSELDILTNIHIPRYYYSKITKTTSIQLHGFSDASEDAYAGVVYLRSVDESNNVHVSFVTSKTKVSPIKCLTIPQLELCGANLLADILNHMKVVLNIPIDHIHAWTDSTIVLSWLDGNLRQFKTSVGNRVSYIIDVVPPTRWGHVLGWDNPADCASWGMLPSQLIARPWSLVDWTRLAASGRGILAQASSNWTWLYAQETDELCTLSHIMVTQVEPAIPFDRFSSFFKLIRVTAWINRFIFNYRTHCKETSHPSHRLSIFELKYAEQYYVSIIQSEIFHQKIISLKSGKHVLSSSHLKLLNPFIDDQGIVCRWQRATLPEIV